MKCEKCGSLLGEDLQCPNCSSLDNINNFNQGNNKNKIVQFIEENKIISFALGLFLVLLLIVILSVLIKPNKQSDITELDSDNRIKFTIDGKDFYLGSKISDLKENGLKYESDDSSINSDSVSLESFYYENTNEFLGVIYCAEKGKCSYDETMLVKANFYDGSKVIVDDFIKIGSSYNEIVEKYGKEAGRFYQNDDFYVWSFGENVGDFYYLLKFDSTKIFTSDKVAEIRIGIWVYDGEYEHTVITSEE